MAALLMLIHVKKKKKERSLGLSKTTCFVFSPHGVVVSPFVHETTFAPALNLEECRLSYLQDFFYLPQDLTLMPMFTLANDKATCDRLRFPQHLNGI